MTIECICLDQDGVLANFAKGALHACHQPDHVITCWDFFEDFGMTIQDFWGHINAVPDFWKNLEEYSWAKDLLDLCNQTADTFIVTSPAWSAECYSGKFEWLTNLGVKPSNICMIHAKYFMAAPGRLLIDDADHNVEKWTANGGEAILFPHAWNSNRAYADDPFGYVKEKLQELTDGEAPDFDGESIGQD